MQLESKSSSLSFDEEGDEVPDLVDADGKVPPPVTEDIPKEKEKLKPTLTRVTTPIKTQSKTIKKDRNRDFMEKLLRRHPDSIQNMRKMRKQLKRNNMQFNQLERESKEAFFEMFQTVQDSSSDFSESDWHQTLVRSE